MIWFFRRLMQGLFSLWLLATITFFLMKFFPGSPFDDEVTLHPNVREQLERQYGLDQPWAHQYLVFVKTLVRGEFGASQFFAGQEARQVILKTFPVTLKISFLALIIALLGGFQIGFFAMLSKTGYLLYELMTLSLLSTPILLVAPLMIYIFSFQLNLLPVALLDGPTSYILPVLAVSLRPLAALARLFYTSMSDNNMSDFLRTARAQGFSERSILLKWNFRNSLMPVLSYLGPLSATLLAGSTMVEVVFAIPGLGTQFVEAVLNRDASMVIGLTLFYGFFVLIFQMIIDMLVAWIDPRTRAQL